MTWCEVQPVDSVFGLAKNARLLAAPAVERAAAQRRFEPRPMAIRVFKAFRYRIQDNRSGASSSRPLAGRRQRCT